MGGNAQPDWAECLHLSQRTNWSWGAASQLHHPGRCGDYGRFLDGLSIVLLFAPIVGRKVVVVFLEIPSKLFRNYVAGQRNCNACNCRVEIIHW